ncbi:MAG: nucleotide exchange factor GrpE [Firmicutes bacterium]|nr:nucleotide exchange factor GrpE [Bacillota bacterium]
MGESADKLIRDNHKSRGVEIPVRIIDRTKGIEKDGPVKIKIGDSAKEQAETKGMDEMAQQPENKPTEEAAAQENQAEQKDARIAELEEQVKRLSAEFSNFQLRQEKRLEEIRKYAAESVILEFFPILDSIGQAQAAISKGADQESIGKGMEMIDKKLREIFQNLGITEIDAKGQKFDPAFHFAVGVEETDQHPDETVLDEYQKGYVYREKVLRPSMVRVSRAPETKPEEPEQHQQM